MGKKCANCGNIIDENVKFCPHCGIKTDYQTKVYFCTNCGSELSEGTKVCSQCGTVVDSDINNNQDKELAPDIKKYAKEGIKKVSKTINEKMGETGDVQIHLYDLVSEVFKKHTKDEEDEIFSCGTVKTTPNESEIVATWPKPWLYSRIFAVLAIVSFILYILSWFFENSNTIPGLVFMGSLVVPFSILIFFWEVNAPRNISFFQVLSMFFLGGVLSLLCTLILFQVTGLGSDPGYFGAMCIGFIEELGKVLIVAWYIKKLNPKYILNGLLIGACVGAGFEAFETAGYVLRSGFTEIGISAEIIRDTIVYRGLTAFGGHDVWAAISGAALVAVKKDKKFELSMLLNGRFLFFFVVVVSLHGLWDSPLTIMGQNGKIIILCVIPWIVILSQIAAGLKQINRLHS